MISHQYTDSRRKSAEKVIDIACCSCHLVGKRNGRSWRQRQSLQPGQLTPQSESDPEMLWTVSRLGDSARIRYGSTYCLRAP